MAGNTQESGDNLLFPSQQVLMEFLLIAS